MPTGYTSSFKLCTVSTLPRIDDALSPPSVRILGRVVGGNPSTSLYLVADPHPSRAETVVVDFDQLVLLGSTPPPNLKDLVMIFGELVENRIKPSRIPPNELGFLTVRPPDPTRVLVAKRMVFIEQGHGDGLDLGAWTETVQKVQTRTGTFKEPRCESSFLV